jgi:hypothetical protein
MEYTDTQIYLAIEKLAGGKDKPIRAAAKAVLRGVGKGSEWSAKKLSRGLAGKHGKYVLPAAFGGAMLSDQAAAAGYKYTKKKLKERSQGGYYPY